MDQLYEGGDVHGGLGGNEQQTEGNCQLVKAVQFTILTEKSLIQFLVIMGDQPESTLWSSAGLP